MKWFLMDEANGEGGDGGSGGQTITADEQSKDAAPAPVKVEDMAAAISEGLTSKTATDDKPAGDIKSVAATKPDGAALTEAERAAEEQRAEDARIAAETQAEEKKKADAAAATKALAEKKPDDAEFQLTADEKKVLAPKAQARFQKLTEYAKAQHDRAESVVQANAQLTEARDNIIGLLETSKTEPDELGRLLDFNYLVKTGTEASLTQALGILEENRAMIYKALGKEAPGVDLLTDHADLKARVDENAISREDAIIIANARRVEAANRQKGEQQQQQQQNQQSQQQAMESGLADIEAWTKKMKSADLDYATKEAKLIPEIAGIIKTYPPNLWVATVERLYKTMTIVKPKLPPANNPLRPSGNGGGAKEPGSMFEALQQGLNYQQK